MLEFRPWPRITRDNPFNVVITEKIDGTNACVIIQDGKLVGVQSRKRLITPEQDNHGFAAWAYAHENLLVELGDGYHYGEWAGPGIQKNPLKLEQRTFFLFNTFRWCSHNIPSCCSVVPILFEGLMDHTTVPTLLEHLKEDTEVEHEGVVVYYPAFDKMTKHTIKSPNGKWAKEINK
jgi:hypothetical protein